MDILLLPGDDIGPEISTATRRVLETADALYSLDLNLEERLIGVAAFESTGCTVPDEVIASASTADGVILGPAGMTAYPENSSGWLNVPGTIRKRLDLYANIRPARTRPGVPGAREGLDVVIVRENTEGFYSDRNMFMGNGELMPTEDVALSIRKISARASERIARAAFETAARRNGQVTAVGKRHVLQISDGLFFQQIHNVARNHADITWREMDIDAMAAELYSRPGKFDVILITNMFGDILSNLAVALSGSLGMAASLNVGDGRAMANAGHGSAPDIAGRDLANPTGLILSAAMLLDWFGEQQQKAQFNTAAAAIQDAIDSSLSDSRTRTRDLGGACSTGAFTDVVITAMRTAVN